jgi:hypothetical protein
MNGRKLTILTGLAGVLALAEVGSTVMSGGRRRYRTHTPLLALLTMLVVAVGASPAIAAGHRALPPAHQRDGAYVVAQEQIVDRCGRCMRKLHHRPRSRRPCSKPHDMEPGRGDQVGQQLERAWRRGLMARMAIWRHLAA